MAGRRRDDEAEAANAGRLLDLLTRLHEMTEGRLSYLAEWHQYAREN